MRYNEDKNIRILASDHDELRHMSIDMGVSIKILVGKLIATFRDTTDPEATYMVRKSRAKKKLLTKHNKNEVYVSSLPIELQKILYQNNNQQNSQH